MKLAGSVAALSIAFISHAPISCAERWVSLVDYDFDLESKVDDGAAIVVWQKEQKPPRPATNVAYLTKYECEINRITILRVSLSFPGMETSVVPFDPPTVIYPKPMTTHAVNLDFICGRFRNYVQ